MPAGQKIITTLHERRQIEADLRDMLTSTSDADLRRRAGQIAALGSQVIPAVIGALVALSKVDDRLLKALGTVAAYLDRDEIVQALRRVVLEPGYTDQSRVGAMTILERFLDQEPDEELLAGLSNPEEVAISSLEEVLARAEWDPSVLAEFVQRLDRQEPDIVLAVAEALQAVGDRRAVDLLRMMAQDVRAEIAARALHALASLRIPEAAEALRALIPVTAPDLRPLAERSLRKLQFAGVPLQPMSPPDPDWRALIGPVDGLGRRSVWFIRGSRQSRQFKFLNILLSDRAGAVEAAGHGQVPALMLPPWRGPGYLHDIPLSGGSEPSETYGTSVLLMLEVSFDLGRRLVLEALDSNRATQIPIAGPLRLFSPWLWDVTGAEALPPRRVPQLGPEDRALSETSDWLLDHPAFGTWVLHGEQLIHAAQDLSQRPEGHSQAGHLEAWVTRLAADLFAEPLVAQVLSQRLEAMSEWLLLAGDEPRACLALAAAQRFAGGAPHKHPLIRAMVRRGLEAALSDLETFRIEKSAIGA